MKTYWDHDEKERANLTEEEVRGLLDFELMQKGVLKVVPPVLKTLEPVTVPTVQMYAVKHNHSTTLVFSRIEEAQAFLQLAPRFVECDWATDVSCAKAGNLAIEPMQVAQEADVANMKVALKANKAKRAENERVQREYDEALKEVEQATQGVWDDWYEVRARANRFDQVLTTLEEYRRLTDGNEALARTFLAKAFKPDEVAAAFEWHGLAPIVLPEAPPAPAAETRDDINF